MKKAMLIVAMAAMTLKASCAVENHFKPVHGKREVSSIDGIDFIYMINLDQRPEKAEDVFSQLRPYGIYPYRFSAVNGWQLSLEEIQDLGVRYQKGMKPVMATTYLRKEGEIQEKHEVMSKVGRTYFGHCTSRGVMGNALSHLSVIEDAYRSGYKTAWIMEDDIEVIQNPWKVVDLVKQLNKMVGRDNWDILFTDLDTKNQRGERVPCFSIAKRPNFTPAHLDKFKKRRKLGRSFYEIGARYGAYSYIISKRGMKRILCYFKCHGLFLPYDMEYLLPPQMRLIAPIQDVVSTQVNAVSDNGAPRYNRSFN